MRMDRRTDEQPDRERERATDMTKLLAAFGSFANALKQGSYVGRYRVAVLLQTLPMPGNRALWPAE